MADKFSAAARRPAHEPLISSLKTKQLRQGDGDAPGITTGEAIDLLEKADPATCWAQGEWSKAVNIRRRCGGFETEMAEIAGMI